MVFIRCSHLKTEGTFQPEKYLAASSYRGNASCLCIILPPITDLLGIRGAMAHYALQREVT